MYNENQPGAPQFCDAAKHTSLWGGGGGLILVKLRLCEMHQKDDRNFVIKRPMCMLSGKTSNSSSILRY